MFPQFKFDLLQQRNETLLPNSPAMQWTLVKKLPVCNFCLNAL